MADLTWKGFDWNFRDSTGSVNANDPMYNGKYDAANITVDGNGYVNLSITKPSGVPHGAEMSTALTNFGYGTYTVVVGSRLDTLQHAVVFGGLFLYSDTGNTGNAAISNNEIDINETSAWGETPAPATSHNYFWNNGGTISETDDAYTTTTDAVTTHVMTWAPGSLTFDSYVGTGTGGTLLKHTVQTTHLPDPTQSNTFMDINLWVYGQGSAFAPTTATATTVIVRDVTYVPYVAPSGTPSNPKFFFMQN